MNSELPLLGATTRPKHKHTASEIRICKSTSDAVYVSMRHARMSQEALASRIFISTSYLSLLLAGKRPWQQSILERIRTVTGSLATLQYAALREGADLYVDPIEQRIAEIEREHSELLQQRAA